MYLYEKENKPEVLCHKTLINNKGKRENVQWSFVSLPFCFNPIDRNGFLAKYSSILSLAYLKEKDLSHLHENIGKSNDIRLTRGDCEFTKKYLKF